MARVVNTGTSVLQGGFFPCLSCLFSRLGAEGIARSGKAAGLSQYHAGTFRALLFLR